MLSEILREITGAPTPTRNDCGEPNRFDWEDNSRSLGWGPRQGEGPCDYPSSRCPKYSSFSCPLGCNIAPVAVLSSTVCPLDGVYRIETLTSLPDLTGISHFVGHPATKRILEEMGSIPSPTTLFSGLGVGECALAASLMNNPRPGGATIPHYEVGADDLRWRVMWRQPG